MAIASECIRSFGEKLLVLQENKSKIVFENTRNQKLKVVEVDDCAIQDGLRCDHLVIEENSIEHFVELKGSDVQHAQKQLAESIKQLSIDPQKQSKNSYVVSTRAPLTTEIQKIQKQFKRDYNSSFKVKNLFSSERL